VLVEARDVAVANGRVEDAVHITCLLRQWAEYYASDAEQANAYDAEALTLAADLPPGPIGSLPAYQHAYHLVMIGSNEEAIAFADKEISRAIEAGADSAVGLMLIWRGAARVEINDERGIADLREGARVLDEQAHPKAAVAAYNLADVLQGLGRLREASIAVEASIATAHRYGDANAKDTTECGRAMLEFHRGERDAAFATLDGVSEDTSEWVFNLVWEVRGRLILDEAPQDSAVAARRHLAYARRVANIEAECNALALLARAELAMGDETEARSSLDQYLEVWKRMGGVMTCSRSLVEVGLVLVACERHDDLAVAADLLRTPTPWTAAAHALAERRYTDAAAILDSLPSIPLRDAARALAGGN
jgi:ATP/maltotriose-dependent transcriptional regulator MalT